jgi:hypothetical protein
MVGRIIATTTNAVAAICRCGRLMLIMAWHPIRGLKGTKMEAQATSM